MNKKGFTILEVMMVLSVIAIIISISIPRINGMRDEANIAKAKSELRTLQIAVESYYINNRAYPSNITTDLTNARPQMIETALNDPFTGNVYVYQKSTPDRYYIIVSQGVGTDPADLPTITAISDAGVLTGALNGGFCSSNKDGLGCVSG